MHKKCIQGNETGRKKVNRFADR